MVDHLKKTRVCGRPLNLEVASKAAAGGESKKRAPRDARPRGDRKPARKSERKEG